MSKAVSKKKATYFAISFLAATICAFAVMSAVSTADAGDKYLENESSQTYGTLEDVYAAEKNPDLIGAVATNGELGFIYYDDYNDVISGELSLGSEDALERQKKKDEKIAQAISEAVAEKYGEDFVSVQAVEESLDELTTVEGMKGATETLNSAMEQSLAQNTARSAEAFDQITEEEYLEMYVDAKQSIGVAIPVYAEDGKTVVGEFIVDVL